MGKTKTRILQHSLNGILRSLAWFPPLRRLAAALTRWRFLRQLAWFRRAYSRRMHYIMERNSMLPELVVLETTNRCNARCALCPQSRMLRSQGVMTDPLFFNIVDACAALGIARLQLNATGEPLLDPAFVERLAYAKRQGIQEVSFFTNAFLLTPEKARRILDAHPDVVVLSLDSYTASTYEAMRRLPFETVKNNILGFLEQNRARAAGVYTVVSTLAAQESVPSLKRHPLHRQLARLASKVVLIPLPEIHNWAGAVHAEGIGQKKGKVQRVACRRLWSSLNILWDGRVALCDMDYEGRVILGDLRTQTIPEIWQGPAYRQVRGFHLQENFSAVLLCGPCPEDVSWWKEHSEDQRKL